MFGKVKIELLLLSLVSFFVAGVKVFEDGKINFSDFRHFYKAIDPLEDIVASLSKEHLSALLSELNDLDAAEKDEIFANVSTELSLENKLTEELAERIIMLSLANYDLFQDIKQKRSDYNVETVAE